MYQGAPSSITAFMAAGTKLAAFGAILRFFYVAVPGLEHLWTPVLWAVAALVFVMVVVGGATRLTGSGLSITEWRPVTGAIPPLTEADWA